MIAPKIPFVKNGQILTATLVNHIIARTEYASRLLREYRCIGGEKILAQPNIYGTKISYSQEKELDEIYAVGIYYDTAISGYKAFLYKISDGTFEEIVFNGFTSITPFGIQNGVIVGSCVDSNNNLVAFKYQNNQVQTFSYNNDSSINTYFRGVFNDKIVGYSQQLLPAPILSLTNGFLFDGAQYSLINYEEPSDFRVTTVPFGIYENLVVGEYNNSNSTRPFVPTKVGLIYNIDTAEFTILNPFGALLGPSGVSIRASAIYENKVVGAVYNKIPGYFSVGYAYDGVSYEQIIYSSKFYTEPTSIYKNIIAGFAADDSNLNPFFSFIYQNGEFQKIQYADSPETYIYGIGVLTQNTDL